jgi:hypothetical protein
MRIEIGAAGVDTIAVTNDESPSQCVGGSEHTDAAHRLRSFDRLRMTVVLGEDHVITERCD